MTQFSLFKLSRNIKFNININMLITFNIVTDTNMNINYFQFPSRN